tara:strand:- start:291 stop:413 length:123 start_codon:yes stop_codon:yes gene_type:complete
MATKTKEFSEVNESKKTIIEALKTIEWLKKQLLKVLKNQK